jgi:hypothetical protein
MLPRVKIYFENGALGRVAPNADGVAGLVATASEVVSAGGLKLATPYVLRTLDDLVALGVMPGAADDNAFLYRHVKEFYAEAGEGAELWLMCFSDATLQSDMVDVSGNTAKQLIQAASGRIRALAVAFNPSSAYTPAIAGGLDDDLATSMLNAQALAEWATHSLYAPLFVILEAREFTGTATDLDDLSTHSYNRVGVLLGDTASDTGGAAVGLLLGRIARIPVQRHIGRVRDSALHTLTAFVGDRAAERADVETIHDRGYITFRTFTGKSGYFFADDSLATAVSDDYRSIARRRTIDKAYRIAYLTLVEFLNDEVPVTDAGELSPAMAKSWESEVETAVISQMTSEGNLGVDPDDPQDTGVKCYINYAQNVVSTGKIEIVLRVKPYGYAKYIDVNLGFMVIDQ